jgi:hypothetical protein
LLQVGGAGAARIQQSLRQYRASVAVLTFSNGNTATVAVTQTDVRLPRDQ